MQHRSPTAAQYKYTEKIHRKGYLAYHVLFCFRIALSKSHSSLFVDISAVRDQWIISVNEPVNLHASLKFTRFIKGMSLEVLLPPPLICFYSYILMNNIS